MQATDAPWQISQDRLKNPGLPSTPSSTVRKRRPDPCLLMAWFWLHGTRDQACPGPPPAFPTGCAIKVPRGVLTDPPQSPSFPHSSDCTHSCPSPRRGIWRPIPVCRNKERSLWGRATFLILCEINSCVFLFAPRMTQFMDLALRSRSLFILWFEMFPGWQHHTEVFLPDQ